MDTLGGTHLIWKLLACSNLKTLRTYKVFYLVTLWLFLRISNYMTEEDKTILKDLYFCGTPNLIT